MEQEKQRSAAENSADAQARLAMLLAMLARCDRASDEPRRETSEERWALRREEAPEPFFLLPCESQRLLVVVGGRT